MTAKDSAPDDDPVVLINVFEFSTDDASAADAFGEGWRERAAVMAGQAGFISADLYQAVDADSRFQLVNVARWASRRDFEAATADPAFRARVGPGAAPGGALTAHPALYRRMHHA
jgi:heme-degrading monooxygenase HmoA